MKGTVMDNVKIEFPVIGPYMDSRSPMNLQTGVFSRLVGVDGRYQGRLRAYPGNRPIHDAVSSFSEVNYEPTFFKYASMVTYDGSDWVAIRGFVTRFLVGTTYKILFHYNTVGSATWASHLIYSGTDSDAANEMDVCSFGKYLYTFIDGFSAFPKVTYYDTGSSQLTTSQMGPYDENGASIIEPTVLSDGSIAYAEDQSDGFLSFRGLYQVAFRVYHADRNLYSGLSAILNVDMDGQGLAGQNCKVSDLSLDSDFNDAVKNTYDYIDVYRTPNLRSPVDTFSGGIFYKEARFAIASWNAITVGTLHDTALVQQEVYDPWATPTDVPPHSGACEYYNGSVFAAEDPDTNGGVGLRWTNPYVENAENFGSQYRYTGKTSDGKVDQFLQVNDYLVASTGSVFYRILKSGGSTGVNRFQEGRAPVSRRGMTAANSTLVMLTSQGLGVLDGNSGNMGIVKTADRVCLDEWTGDLSNITAAYDARMGCTFFLNPEEREVLCLWDTNNAVTLLEGAPFMYVTQGPSVAAKSTFGGDDDGDSVRAYFVTDVGRVVTPDYDRSWGKHSMLGYASGEDAGNKEVEEGDTKSALASTYDGRFIYMSSGSYAGEFSYATGGGLSGITGLGGVGSEYSVDPVITRVRFWPLRLGEGDRFSRKVVKSISLSLKVLSGFDSGRAKRFRVGLFRDCGGEDDDDLEISGLVEYSSSKSLTDYVKTLNCDGVVLEPYFEHGSHGKDFELSAVQVITKLVETSSLEA